MPKYTLLKAYPIAYDKDSDDNHIFIHALAMNQEYSVAINVCSNVFPKNMYYVIKKYHWDSFKSNTIERRIMNKMKHLKDSFNVIHSYDFFKLSYEQNWFDTEELMIADVKLSPNNQLGKEVIRLTKEVINDPEGYICAFGISWGPKPVADRTFGFYPTRGIHDVHCNTENGHDTNKNRPASVHDGALFFYIPSENAMYGVFCMFSGQF